MSLTIPPTELAIGSNRRMLAVGAALGAVGVLAAFVFKTRCGVVPDQIGQYLRGCYSDIPPLYFAERLNEGAIPYLDHAVEYPPLTGLVMWVAALLPGGTVNSYWVWHAVMFIGCGAITGALLARAVGVKRTLVFAAAPTLIVSGAVNWDLPSMALATAGLVAHRRGKDGWAGVWLGLGTAAKLWPALLIPAVVLGGGVLRGRSAAARASAAAAVAWLAVNLPVIVLAPDSWLRFIQLNRDRVADWDSMWRLVPGWLGVQLEVSTINIGALLLTLLGSAVLLVLAIRWDPPDRWHLVALPLVAWFLLVNKVWSPQFTLWLLPLLALATPPVRALVALAIADVAVTVTRFPYLGSAAGLEEGWGPVPFETAVTVRWFVVAIVAVWGWRIAARGTGSAPRTVLRIPPPRVTS